MPFPLIGLLIGAGVAAVVAAVAKSSSSGGGGSDSSEKDYDSTYGGDKTSVRTVRHSDGTSTEYVQYKDKNDETNILMKDLDANGNEIGHTTAHPDQVNYHGDHSLKE